MSRFKTRKVFKAYIQWQKENTPKCLWCKELNEDTIGLFAIDFNGKKYHYCKKHNELIHELLETI